MLLISNKNHTATLHSGKSQSSAVYSDWPYLNAKIQRILKLSNFLSKKFVKYRMAKEISEIFQIYLADGIGNTISY